jgi:hypothetical protein
MPATPNQVQRQKIVSHTVDFGDGVTVDFSFDRNKITDAWFDRWGQLEKERSSGALNVVLHDLLLGWDMVNDDGSPYPLTPENLRIFSIPDKGLIVEELMRAAVPQRAEGEGSSAISSTPSTPSMEQPASHPNGPQPSLSPAPSESPSLK